jgi:NAD(P)H dehydrogenase (quinone)
MPPVAVTGSTGALGSRVARRLSDLGIPQRLLVRNPSRAPDLAGAEIVAASYQDGAAMRAALEGIDTLFLVSGHEALGRVPLHISAIDAAKAARVRRIVYVSFLAAAADATFTFARDHAATEHHIASTGLAYTFLRDSLYLDDLPSFIWADGAIAGPAGDGRVAPVSRDDIADVAAQVLADATDATPHFSIHDGVTYDLTGPTALTMAEIAAVLSEVSGVPVRYHAETLDEARASRAPSGAPDWEIEGWVSSYAAIATGELDVVSDTVARLAGHPATSVRDWLLAHRESWRRLAGGRQ